uniref:Uncharacterized protein n=1 Tax=Anguilla anguilla TaxID=7936 RepID=A0A0E9SBB6_ANGAN
MGDTARRATCGATEFSCGRRSV